MNGNEKYVIVLDCNTATGSMYVSGNNDGFATDQNLQHPFLACTEIEMGNPYYIRAIRFLSKEAESRQILYLPHGSVLAIYEFSKESRLPFGFQFL